MEGDIGVRDYSFPILRLSHHLARTPILSLPATGFRRRTRAAVGPRRRRTSSSVMSSDRRDSDALSLMPSAEFVRGRFANRPYKLEFTCIRYLVCACSLLSINSKLHMRTGKGG